MKHFKAVANTIVSEQLLSKHGECCPYCGVFMDVSSVKRRPTKDHIRPKQRFKHEQDFRQFVVCSECNYMKGALTLHEFIASILSKNKAFEEALKLNEERLIRLNYLIHMGLR